MNRTYRRALPLSLILAALGASSATAGLGDLFRRGGQKVGATVCTVVAGPVAASPASREADVLCLDTTIQMGLEWVRFSAGDRSKVDRKIVLGATLTVRNSSGIIVDGFPVLQANRWEAKRSGNPARRDFLVMDAARLPLLAWGLRDHPEVARHFRLNFAQVAAELSAVYYLFGDLGLEVPGLQPWLAEPEPAPEVIPDPAASAGSSPELVNCRAVLREARDALGGLAPVAVNIATSAYGPDHHDEVGAFRAASEALRGIELYFDVHP